jgi:hypothetical protein
MVIALAAASGCAFFGWERAADRLREFPPGYHVKDQRLVYRVVGESHGPWRDDEFLRISARSHAYTLASQEVTRFEQLGVEAAKQLKRPLDRVQWHRSCVIMLQHGNFETETKEPNKNTMQVVLAIHPEEALADPRLESLGEAWRKAVVQRLRLGM